MIHTLYHHLYNVTPIACQVTSWLHDCFTHFYDILCRFLALIFCSDNFFKTRNDSATYKGTLAKTVNSAPCVSWTTTGLPSWHSHSFSDGYVSAAGAYCRNPGASQTAAWCYINATTAAYGHCRVPDPREYPLVNLLTA